MVPHLKIEEAFRPSINEEANCIVLSVPDDAKGERLVCEAWVLKAGRTLSFTEAEVYAVTGAQRTLVMKASATMALVPAQAA